MAQKETGRPAFPVDTLIERDEKGHMHGYEISSQGISVRDYFAAQAMSALIRQLPLQVEGKVTKDRIASAAYFIAEAMLVERAK